MVAYLVIVRRGDPGRFEALFAGFHGTPEVTIGWDRRQEERRVGRGRPPTPERRLQDRRGPLPASWAALDFLITTGEAPQESGGL